MHVKSMCCSRKFKEGAQSQKGSAGLRKQFWIRIQLYRFFLYFLSIIVLLHYSSLTLITPPPFKLYISVNGWVIWVTFHVFEEHYFKALSSFIQYRNMCASLVFFLFIGGKALRRSVNLNFDTKRLYTSVNICVYINCLCFFKQ